METIVVSIPWLVKYLELGRQKFSLEYIRYLSLRVVGLSNNSIRVLSHILRGLRFVLTIGESSASGLIGFQKGLA